MSYVKFKVKAGSEGVVLGPMKYFPPAFCQADHFTHFKRPRLACLKNGELDLEASLTSSIIGRIRSPSVSESCQIQG